MARAKRARRVVAVERWLARSLAMASLWDALPAAETRGDPSGDPVPPPLTRPKPPAPLVTEPIVWGKLPPADAPLVVVGEAGRYALAPIPVPWMECGREGRFLLLVPWEAREDARAARLVRPVERVRRVVGEDT